MTRINALNDQDEGLIQPVLAALRADHAVQDVLGRPARLYDDETHQACTPYAVLEQYQQTISDSSESIARIHTLTLSTRSDYGGLSEARQILKALCQASERLQLCLQGQRLVLSYVKYCDAMRAPDRLSCRGIVRLCILMEESL